jgi:uncharacterized membrane protein
MFSSLGSGLTALIPGASMLLAKAEKAKQDSDQTFQYLTQLGIWGGVLLLMIVLAVMVVRRLRDGATQSRQSGGDMLSNFQEMQQEGDISDAEFRNIKAVLGNQLRSDVKSGKKTL